VGKVKWEMTRATLAMVMVAIIVCIPTVAMVHLHFIMDIPLMVFPILAAALVAVTASMYMGFRQIRRAWHLTSLRVHGKDLDLDLLLERALKGSGIQAVDKEGFGDLVHVVGAYRVGELDLVVMEAAGDTLVGVGPVRAENRTEVEWLKGVVEGVVQTRPPRG